MAAKDQQGSLFAKAGISQEEVDGNADQVLHTWKDFREDKGKAGALTFRRKVPILKALQAGYSVTDLQTYLRWVFTSDDSWPKWMRKEGRDYTETANLFRRCHLQEQLPKALRWLEREDGASSPEEPGWFACYGDRVYTG